MGVLTVHSCEATETRCVYGCFSWYAAMLLQPVVYTKQLVALCINELCLPLWFASHPQAQGYQ